MPSRSVFDGRSLTLYRSDGSIVGSWSGDRGGSADDRELDGPQGRGFRCSMSIFDILTVSTGHDLKARR